MLAGQQGGSAGLTLLPMLGMGGSAVYFFQPGAHPFMKVMGALMVVSAVTMGIAHGVHARHGSGAGVRGARRDYLRYLAHTRETVRATARAQRLAEYRLFPDPAQLWAVVAERRQLWERRPGDADFAQVRVGVGPQPLATRLVVPQAGPAEEWEPLAAHALARFVATYEHLDGMPLALSLRACPRLTVRGHGDTVLGNARALVCQLAALHAPEDLWVAVVAGPGSLPEWDWVKWLPHARPACSGGCSGRRGPDLLLFPSLDALAERLTGELSAPSGGEPGADPLPDRPHVVILVDTRSAPPAASADGIHRSRGVTVIELVPQVGSTERRQAHGLPVPRPCLTVHPGDLTLTSASGAVYTGTPDVLSAVEATAVARALAPLRTSDDEEADPLLGSVGFADLVGIEDVAVLGPPPARRNPQERLRVPLGVDAAGDPVVLDLKEAALGGMGPHGLCVGATGSGKSELLRTLVLGLAATHGPDTLNFVLADFKGGAAFAGLAELPHVAAFITNLATDLTLVDRMEDALSGELLRRQELLRTGGNFANIGAYERARAAGAPLEPLPSLLIVLDEFSELLSARPAFIDTFLRIGRIGRSLGMHLLLASQRVEEGRLRGLETYLSYRVVMRTFSAEESRIALGVPDAYYLPSVPGAAFLSYGTEAATPFRSAYVSGPYRRPRAAEPGSRDGLSPVLFTADPAVGETEAVREDEDQDGERDDDEGAVPSVLDVVVERLRDNGPPARPIWLPPLETSPSLGDLLPALTSTMERGLHPVGWQEMKLVIPVGIADVPFEQRRSVLTCDFAGALGHAAVVGGPRSGKSTLLQTLVMSFALTHTPREVQFYCLDFGEGSLRRLTGLPHVGGVASRLDPAKVRRTVAEIREILDEREEFFRAHHIDSIRTYRGRRAVGHYADHVWGDVFLVIDGWGPFKREYEQLIPDIEAMAVRGLALGVHLVLAAGRYNEIRPALKDHLGTRLELRMADPLDSEHDRKRARNVPKDRPGHGLVRGGLHYVTALPHADALPGADGLGAAGDRRDEPDPSEALIAAVAAHWSGAVCPPVRVLPDRVPADALPKASETPNLGFSLGLDEADLSPVHLDFDADPLLLIYGESESGKTALLRLISRRIAERHQPQGALLIVGDYRRTLHGRLPESHVLHYAPASASLEEGLTRLVPLLAARMPTCDVSPEQMRARSWWHGPELFVVIDDYDLVAFPSGDPLEALADFFPYARDIGLRVIVARSTAGAARASFAPVTRRLREVGATGIVLSGSPDEGVLVGSTTAEAMPPGRARLVSPRRPPRVIQVGWHPEA